MKDKFWRVTTEKYWEENSRRPPPHQTIWQTYYFHDRSAAMAFVQDRRQDNRKAFIQGDVFLSKNDQISISLEG